MEERKLCLTSSSLVHQSNGDEVHCQCRREIVHEVSSIAASKKVCSAGNSGMVCDLDVICKTSAIIEL